MKAEDFVEELLTIGVYWSEQGETKKDAAEGAIFSFLSLLDGCSSGSYAVRPIDDEGKEGDDIAGGLHGIFCGMQKEKGKELEEFRKRIVETLKKGDSKCTKHS